ncbi:MAG: transporter substrate-binding domain-containing protein [Chloroflexi bacterium]|nr:transporter substrate-binding domain-containing protein [Chloroflexota bacterium]
MKYLLLVSILAVLVIAGCSRVAAPIPVPAVPGADAAPGGVPAAGPPAVKSPVKLSGLTYLTEEYPPHSSREGGVIRGISVDLLDLIFNNLEPGLTREKIQFLTWSEGYQRALNERNSVFFSALRLPERESLFKWAGPVAPETVAVLTLAYRKPRVQSASDLRTLRIGAVKDDWGMDLLVSAGYDRMKVQIAPNGGNLIGWLEAGKIDALAHGEMAARWWMKESCGDPDSIAVAYVLGEAQTYYAFNRDTPDDVVRAFQEALDSLKRDRGPDGISPYEKVMATYLVPKYARDSFTREQVTRLVEQTAADIGKDAAGTFKKVNAGEHPYRDRQDPALYVFVYDMEVTVVAHAYRASMVGENYRGQTDTAGKKFRDEIVEGALRDGSGWVDYVTTKADESGLFFKSSYYRLARGSDGRDYAVSAGLFKERPGG